MVRSIYYPRGIDLSYDDYSDHPTLEELAEKDKLSLWNVEVNKNTFGFIETHCFSLGVKAKELVSIKNLNYDWLIFYCLEDIKNGYYEETNKIDLAISLYKNREEFIEALIGIKGGNEVVYNLLYEIRDSLDKEDDSSKNIFNEGLELLINHYVDILGLKEKENDEFNKKEVFNEVLNFLIKSYKTYKNIFNFIKNYQLTRT